MQKTIQVNEFVLLPVPAEMAEALELNEFTTIQYYVDGNRLVIEAVDEEECLPRRGNGCCPCQNCCEEAFG